MNKRFKSNSLDKLFYPKSIAVIGASNDSNKIGGFILSQILNNKDIKPYPINLKETNVQGAKAYQFVSDIKSSVDLAIIAIPSNFVLNAVLDCVKAKIVNIVIISAGFKEVGEEGAHRENQLKEIIAKNKLNIIGPNCLGFLNAEINLNCSFAKDIPSVGGTALISQSGAVIDGIIDWSFKHKIGFSKIVSVGNMAGVDELQMLEYLKEDPKTSSIVFYMETLERGEKFGEVLREISKKKPVIIIKPGTSDNAKKAIGSHTGSLAQDNILVETLIRENNGILVKSLNELFNVLIGLKSNKLPQDNNIVILTNAGGPGVIATDACAVNDFNIYRFSDKEKSQFKLPNEASLNNPVDMLGDAKSDRYLSTLESISKMRGFSNVLVLLTPQIMTDSEEIAKSIVKFSKKSDKNFFSCFIGDKEIKSALDYFDCNDFANFQTPNDAINTMKLLRDYNLYNYKDEVKIAQYVNNNVEKKLKGKSGLLDYELTKEVLFCMGLEVPEKIILKSLNDIITTKLTRDKKYVLKLDGEDFVHKKDIGGVILDITYKNFEDEAANLYNKVSKKTKNFAITLEEEVSGVEVIAGLKHDNNLGNFIIFGMGGTYVNVFKDVNFSTCPLTINRAKKLVESSKVSTLLNGYRDIKRVNLEKLYDVIIRLSYLQEIFPQIKEVDLNPIICNEDDVYLVDVKLII